MYSVERSPYSVIRTDIGTTGDVNSTPTGCLHGRRRFLAISCLVAVAAAIRLAFQQHLSWNNSSSPNGIPELIEIGLPPPVVLGIISDEELKSRTWGNATSKSLEFDPEENSTETTSANLRRMCPRWSPEFADRFAQRCGHWLALISEWDRREIPDYRGSAVYTCANFQDETECHGWGDRLTGMLGVFIQAIMTQRNFRVHFNGLHSLFAPCAFKSKQAAWGDHASNKEYLMMRNEKCRPTKYDECSAVANINKCEKPSSPLIYPDLNRACIPRATCADLSSSLGDSLTTSDVFGCPTRAFMEPTPLFLNRQVKFLVDRNESKKMTIGEIEEWMSKYRVIAVHVRMGDFLSFTKSEKLNANHNHQLLVPLRCASTLDSHIAASSSGDMSYPTSGRGRKETRWLVASDSESYREIARRTFGDKVVMLDITPRHIAEVNKRDERVNALADTLAEWYLLGKADELVLNRVSYDRHRRDEGILEGRISSFPKTAWAFNLKHEFYDADGCVAQSFPYDGGWRSGGATTKECWRSSIAMSKQTTHQPHLEILRRHNVSFPKYWVRDGKVVSAH